MRVAWVRGFSCGDIARGDVEDWVAAKERAESTKLRKRANVGIAISGLSLAVELAGLLVALLK